MSRFVPVQGWGSQPIPKGMKWDYSLTHDYERFVGVKARKDDTVNAKYQYSKVFLMKRKTDEYISGEDMRRRLRDEGVNRLIEAEWDDIQEYRIQSEKNYHYFFINQKQMDDFSRLADLEPETQEYEEWMKDWKDTEFVDECYGEPALLQKKELLEDTVWIPQEWFPIIGRERVELRAGGDSPFTIWGDRVGGSWRTIDGASGWGSLGKRKHPQKLNTKEKLKAWGDWTNDYLMKNAICENGRMYLAHERKEGYNKDFDRWKTSYMPFLYMFNFGSLRPMLKIEGILKPKSWKSDGYYGYGQKRTTRRLDWETKYADRPVFVKGGEWYERRDGTGSSTKRPEDWYAYEPKSHETPFMRTYRAWSRAKTSDVTEKGFQVDTKMAQNRHGEYLADKIVDPIYRDLLLVWIPHKPMDFDFYQTGIVNSIPPLSACFEWDSVRQ